MVTTTDISLCSDGDYHRYFTVKFTFLLMRLKQKYGLVAFSIMVFFIIDMAIHQKTENENK